MVTSYSISSKPKPEEIAEQFSQAWAVEQVAEIERWLVEGVLAEAEDRYNQFKERVLFAIQQGHPSPRLLAQYTRKAGQLVEEHMLGSRDEHVSPVDSGETDGRGLEGSDEDTPEGGEAD